MRWKLTETYRRTSPIHCTSPKGCLQFWGLNIEEQMIQSTPRCIETECDHRLTNQVTSFSREPTERLLQRGCCRDAIVESLPNCYYGAWQ